jgi:hypothetical protein
MRYLFVARKTSVVGYRCVVIGDAYGYDPLAAPGKVG